MVTAEPVVDVRTHQNLNATVVVVKLAFQERNMERMAHQIVEVTAAQDWNVKVEAVMLAIQECIQESGSPNQSSVCRCVVF